MHEYYNVIIYYNYTTHRVTDTGAALDAPTPTRHIIFAISFIYMEQILMLIGRGVTCMPP